MGEDLTVKTPREHHRLFKTDAIATIAKLRAFNSRLAHALEIT
jgi:hypothetical protein